MSENKIVMVNSFKGGSGKTSIALGLCVADSYKTAFKEDKIGTYKIRKIIYIDIDILGTAVEYSVFKIQDNIKYMEIDKEFPCNKILFPYLDGQCTFDAYLLNPANRNATSYVASLNRRSNSGSLEPIFFEKLITFIKELVDKEENFFIILDCSPGLSDYEKLLIEKIHSLKKETSSKFDFCECFITTIDASHIEKTISSMKHVCEMKVNLDERDILLIVNDLSNISNFAVKTDVGKEIDEEKYCENLCSYIHKKICDNFKSDKEKKQMEEHIRVEYNKYSPELVKSNLLFLTENTEAKNLLRLETNPDTYNLYKIHEKVMKSAKNT